MATACRPQIYGTDLTPASVSTTASSAFNRAHLQLKTASTESQDSFSDVRALETRTQILEIKNIGSKAALAIETLETSDAFNISAITCTRTLLPGISCQIAVTFTPPGAGQYATSIQASYRDEDGLLSAETLPVTGTAIPQPTDVLALYPAKGSNWNDYVKNDGTNTFAATDTACDGTETGNYFQACIHGGEKRKVVLPLISSCTGLTYSDELNAFDWQCTSSPNGIEILSRSLKKWKYLSDLLTSTSWRNNRISVFKSEKLIYQSSLTPWWTNPIKTSLSSVLSVGAIYVISGGSVTRATGITTASKSAIVVMPDSQISITATSNIPIFKVTNKNFFWFEGRVSANSFGLAFSIDSNSKFARLQNIKLKGFTDYFSFAQGGKHYVTEATATRETGPNAGPANAGAITTAANSEDLLITQVKIIGTQSCIRDLAVRSVFSNIHCIGNNSSSNSYPAFVIGDGNTIVSQLFLTNTGSYGVRSYTDALTNRATILGAMSLRNHNNIGGQGGSLIDGLNQSTLYHLVGVEMNYALINRGHSSHYGQLAGDRLRSIAEVSENGNHFLNYALIGNYFSYNYDSINPCYIAPGVVSPGISANCQSTDNMTVTSVANLWSSFIGEVTTDDSKNTTDSGSPVAFSSGMDFLNYENFWRSWGKAKGLWGIFPFINLLGDYDQTSRTWGSFACDDGTGKTCSLWDWRLKSTDTTLRNKSGDGLNENEPFEPGATCPSAAHGNKAVTDQAGRTFLVNALEFIGDGIGNDNSLCESNESCFFMPNIGSYQGEGEITDACNFQSGTVSGVTLKAYSENGG